MDNAAKVAEVAWLNAYLFKLDIRMDTSMSLFMKTRENTLEFFGKESTMSLQYSPLVGNPAPIFTTQSLKLLSCT